MRLSDVGLKSLMHEEGFENDAYPDPAHGWAVPTIGVGHTGPEVHQGLHWTDEQVMEALRKDVEPREAAINRLVKVPLNQNQFDALVDFVFNTSGPDGGAFARSTLLRKLNEGNYIGAADEFLKWNIPSILIPRRHRTRALFLGENAPAPKANTVYVDMKAVQRIVGVKPDGLWGPQTKGAVMRWQAAHGLEADGIVGPKTTVAMGLA